MPNHSREKQSALLQIGAPLGRIKKSLVGRSDTVRPRHEFTDDGRVLRVRLVETGVGSLR